MAAVVAAIVIGIVAFDRWFDEGERRLEEELTHLEQSGEPASAAELERMYLLPDGAEDATKLWTEAGAVLAAAEKSRFERADVAEQKLDQGELPPLSSPWDELDVARNLLAKHEKPLRMLHEAAAMGGAARYETDFENGFARNADYIGGLRSASRILRIEARVRTRDGDTDGALRSLHTKLLLGRSLETCPQLIEQLVRIAIAKTSYETIAATTPFLHLTDDQLANLQRQVLHDDYDKGLYLACLGERVGGLIAFANPAKLLESTDGDTRSEHERAKFRQWSESWMERDRAFYLRQMRNVTNGSQAPWPQKLDFADELNAELEELLQRNHLVQMQHMFSLLLLPAHDAYFAAAARATAHRNATATMLAIERYRLQHEELPESLNQLVPDFLEAELTDPFTGGPLRYRIREASYVVYSVSQNRQDDGGIVGDDGWVDVCVEAPISRQIYQGESPSPSEAP